MSDELFASWPPGGLDETLTALQQKYLPSLQIFDLEGLLLDPLIGRAAMVSSFGVESACLLHIITRIIPEIDVIFLDTGKHFSETLSYRDQLRDHIGLNIVNVTPDDTLIQAEDPLGMLHKSAPHACCMIRKTVPLQDILSKYNSWISGRKRYQGDSRANISIIERDAKHIKLNPLALWSKKDIHIYMSEHGLPLHPLVKKEYFSIGCKPCTQPTACGSNERAGRWADHPEKTECGIHLGPEGNFVRALKVLN